MEKYLRDQAGNIWNLQKRAWRYHLRLREETITERLLLSIAHDADPKTLMVCLFTPAKEAQNGSDWEWHFSSPLCDIGFRVQAKKLFPAPLSYGKYDNFKPTSIQTRKLIAAAYADDCNPIFVFYNHPEVRDYSLMEPKGRYTSSSIWGCAVAHAVPLVLARDAKLATIFPYCAPWHEFFSGAVCNIENLMSSSAPHSVVYRSKPNWASDLYENVDLTEYCVKRNLSGVVHFEASENFTQADFRTKSRRL